MSALDPKLDNTQQDEFHRALFDSNRDELYSSKIDELVSSHPELQKSYDDYQEALKLLVSSKAIPCEPRLLEGALGAIKSKQAFNFQKFMQYAAASIALFLGVLCFQLYQNNLELKA